MPFELSRIAAPARTVLLTPQGRLFNQEIARELSRLPRLVLICGRYEGVDERVAEYFTDDQISIGDYVLTGGELAAMVVVDAVARLLPGVLGNVGSAVADSFSETVLEHPQYTRPQDFEGMSVPAVLLCGSHESIRRWRRGQALLRTRMRRPDLFARLSPTAEDIALLESARGQLEERNSEAAQTARRRRQIARLQNRRGQRTARQPTVGNPVGYVEPMMAQLFLALIHYPVLNRMGDIIASAITNLDLHDLARSCRTYGVPACYIVTPLRAPAGAGKPAYGSLDRGQGRRNSAGEA